MKPGEVLANPPATLRGNDLICGVQSGTGDFAGNDTIRCVFDLADDYFAVTFAGAGHSQMTSGTLSYTYAKSGSVGTVVLNYLGNALQLVLTFSRANGGSFTGSFTAGKSGSVSGTFVLNPLIITTLQNNVTGDNLADAVAGGQSYFKIAIPPSQAELTVRAAYSGFFAPFEILVRHGAPASPALADYDLETGRQKDVITIRKPAAGDWYITLAGSQAYAGASLVAGYQTTTTCSYVLDSQFQTIGAEGGTGQVQVSPSNGCTWTVSSGVNWIIVTSPTNSFGNDTVAYSVAANTTGTPRTGTLTIEGQVLTVYQEAGAVLPDLAPVSLSGGTISITESDLTYPVILLDATHYHMPENDFYLDNSGLYTYTKTGSASGQVVLTITSPLGAGRRTTILLVFDGPSAGTFSSSSTGGGFPDDTTSGTFAGTDLPAVPQILLSPQDHAVLPGANVTLTVQAVGPEPFKYQWQRNGVNLVDGDHIAGTTSPSLSLTAVSTTDAGIYRVIVSNSFGSATSEAAVLDVVPVAAAQPTLTVLGRSADGQIQFQFTSHAGLNYVVTRQAGIAQAPGQDVGAWLGTGAPIKISLPSSPDPIGFYRVRVE